MYARRLAGLIFVVCVGAAFTGTLADDAKKIQGAWKLISATGFDKEETQKTIVKIDGDRIMFLQDGNERFVAKYRLNPKTKPREIDLARPDSTKELFLPGIYDLSGDDLKICFLAGLKGPAEIKKDKEVKIIPAPPVKRPTEFKAGGNFAVLVILKRQK